MWVQVGKTKDLNSLKTAKSALKSSSVVHANKFEKLASEFVESDHLSSFTRLV